MNNIKPHDELIHRYKCVARGLGKIFARTATKKGRVRLKIVVDNVIYKYMTFQEYDKHIQNGTLATLMEGE